MLSFERERIFEIVILAVFSVFVLVLFFSLLSMNGLVLGNDPAVHIERTYMFLETGSIPLGDIAWYPPLYHILLASFMAFMGVNSIEQMIVLVKFVTAIIDWLLILSVYLFAGKFFGRKVGILASILMLFLFPLYEINFWGGYPTLLSLSFMILLFLYLSIEKKLLAGNLFIFLFAFSLVLSHQLTALLSFLIVVPFVLVVAVRSRGRYSKAWIAAIFGGLFAFFLYYAELLIPHLNDILVIHIFAEVRSMVYQIPLVSPYEFAINFGFAFVFSFIGIFLAFGYRTKDKRNFYLLLLLSFLVPFILSQSYLFGVYLPYQRFVYYLLPSLAIFAAVCLSSIIGFTISFYRSHALRRRRLNFKITTTFIVALLVAMFVFRFGVVYGKVMESSAYYSTSDIKAYDAGSWLRVNYPDAATVVDTKTPGSWFALFSGKSTIAAVDSASGRNDVAETVLHLTYEIENPVTLLRAYDFRGDISDESYVSLDTLWKRVSYSSGDGNFFQCRVNGVDKKTTLSSLNREVFFDNAGSSKKLTINYFNTEVAINQTILVPNDSYAITVTWTISPLEGQISDAALYLSTFFDLYFSFEDAYVPGVLNWENPWSRPSNSDGNNWAVVNFTSSTLADNYLGLYDGDEEVLYALNFEELPDWGNVGVLASKQIDAVRFQYNFESIDQNQPVSFIYRVLTFSMSSYPEIEQILDLKGTFTVASLAQFEINTRDYKSLIREKNIEFIIYDKNELDTKIIQCKLIEMVYSNDRYVIFKVKNNVE